MLTEPAVLMRWSSSLESYDSIFSSAMIIGWIWSTTRYLGVDFEDSTKVSRTVRNNGVRIVGSDLEAATFK